MFGESELTEVHPVCELDCELEIRLGSRGVAQTFHRGILLFAIPGLSRDGDTQLPTPLAIALEFSFRRTGDVPTFVADVSSIDMFDHDSKFVPGHAKWATDDSISHRPPPRYRQSEVVTP